MENKIKFQVPDKKKREFVLGKFENDEKDLENFLNILRDQCQIIQKPKQGDWLHENPHEGQTFTLYKSRVLKMGEGNIATEKKNTIYFQFLDKGIDQNTQQILKNYAQAFFQLPVEILQNNITLNKMKQVQIREETDQYCALDIFNQIDKLLPQNGLCIIGITLKDLYIDDENNFVFGLADPRARKGIFSFCRYFPNFYEENEKEKYENIPDIVIRLGTKVLCHEITHLFGLRHCAYYQCIMKGSNSLQEDSKNPMHLCPVCLRKLMVGNSKINIIKRYEDLQKICQENKQIFQKEQLFYQNLLQQLQNKE